MRQAASVLVLIASLLGLGAADAASISVLIGDKDGFGIGVNPDQGFAPSALPGYDGPGDSDGTDKWFYNQQSVQFAYVLPEYPINAARLEVFTGGQGFDPFNAYVGAPTSVFLNDVFIGYLTIGDVLGVGTYSNIARKDIFDLGPFLGLLTGTDTIRFRPYYTGTAFGDGWVLDYAELTLQTRSVPEPGTLALLGLGLAGLGLSRRRKGN